MAFVYLFQKDIAYSENSLNKYHHRSALFFFFNLSQSDMLSRMLDKKKCERLSLLKDIEPIP